MILITGAAGFIGYHVSLRLLRLGHVVHGVDSLNDYYDPALKRSRLSVLTAYPHFTFQRIDISHQPSITELFSNYRPDYVIHLAAQAGVRHSMRNPLAYIDSNITGFLHILEGCRHHNVKHLVYASSSSVYGLNASMPFSVHHRADHPISLYGATKKANELMAHSYSHLYQLPTTGLRFFTVYGPWGRPDMAYFLFTKAILAGMPIEVYNEGHMRRDFTYIDDVVEGVVRVMEHPASPNRNWRGVTPDAATSTAPYKLYNVGNHSPVELKRLIEILEQCLGKKAIVHFLPMQPGDVLATAADIDDLNRDFAFAPSTAIETGIGSFVQWYLEYYRHSSVKPVACS